MKPTRLLALLAALAAAASAALLLLPLRGQGVGECCNVATSLAATVNAPVNGDQKFFELPNGPSNVMFLLDNSGSMDEMVQCGRRPVRRSERHQVRLAQQHRPGQASAPGSTGTCTLTNSPNLAWMTLKDKIGVLYTKDTAPNQFDPGHGAVANVDGLIDNPTWGSVLHRQQLPVHQGEDLPYKSWTQSSATPIASCNSSGLAHAQRHRADQVQHLPRSTMATTSSSTAAATRRCSSTAGGSTSTRPSS